EPDPAGLRSAGARLASLSRSSYSAGVGAACRREPGHVRRASTVRAAGPAGRLQGAADRSPAARAGRLVGGERPACSRRARSLATGAGVVARMAAQGSRAAAPSVAAGGRPRPAVAGDAGGPVEALGVPPRPALGKRGE